MHRIGEHVAIGGRYAAQCGDDGRHTTCRVRGVGETESQRIGENGVEQFVAIEIEQVLARQSGGLSGVIMPGCRLTRAPPTAKLLPLTIGANPSVGASDAA
jgi:hypothetical protein